ncbi:MAG: PEP-CTERM sorting domain-containing protein [Candidatus Omnitrophica bacterium COP1]|nr:PEP-CTERM sorting domain-containing protein [Candidatus Omnitrophica bacterium COP1]
MKCTRNVSMLAAFLVCLSGASALSINNSELQGLSWSFTSDPSNDAASSSGTSYETFGMGSAIKNGFLYVVVQTNFPEAGGVGSDSYTSVTHFSPGDLYVNVGGSFQNGGGSIYGLATTTHANVVQQAYSGNWSTFQSGKLYQNAVFATGTFEQYQLAHPNYKPDDGDGNNRVNSYPTLLRGGNQVAGDISGVLYRAASNSNWAYEIIYKISLGALGLTGGSKDPLTQLFWVMECGNDGVEHFVKSGTDPVVPEPTTLALMVAGIGALAAKRRRA